MNKAIVLIPLLNCAKLTIKGRPYPLFLNGNTYLCNITHKVIAYEK